MNEIPTTDTTLAIVRKAGLTQSQAKGYLALIEHGQLSPVELAESTGESRTNGYMICEKLEKLGLATKKDGKKALYAPTHPSALETLAEKRRKVITRNEQEVKSGLSPLIDLFYTHTEMPGTRTLQGKDGIKAVYEDTLRQGNPIYLWRTTGDAAVLGHEYYRSYRADRADAGIATYAITPYSEVSRKHILDGEDEKYNYHRTFIDSDIYTAPVEIDVYGDKVAFIAFGDTQMATILNSPAIAEAVRQIIIMTANAHRADSDALIAKIKAGMQS